MPRSATQRQGLHRAIQRSAALDTAALHSALRRYAVPHDTSQRQVLLRARLRAARLRYTVRDDTSLHNVSCPPRSTTLRLAAHDATVHHLTRHHNATSDFLSTMSPCRLWTSARLYSTVRRCAALRSTLRYFARPCSASLGIATQRQVFTTDGTLFLRHAALHPATPCFTVLRPATRCPTTQR